MKFTYNGVLDVATVHGVTFKKGEATEVKCQDVQSKLKGNSQFSFNEATKEVDTKLEDLRQVCDRMGLEYHHRAGADKLEALIEAALSEQGQENGNESTD